MTPPAPAQRQPGLGPPRRPRAALLRAHALAAALLTLIPALAAAQSRRASIPAADSLLTRALASAATGDTSMALDLLERANKLAGKDPEILYWRGLMLARTTFLRMGDVPRNILAWRLLDRAAELDPTNPRYLMEMGRIRLYTPLLRLEAERLFRKALRVAEESGDPGQIADVAWELGQIKHRRYATGRDRYLITSPGMLFDAAQAIDQKHYTREFLEQHSRPIEEVGLVDRSEAEEMYRRGLRALPTHEPNAVGLLGLLYDASRFQEMLEVTRPFLDARSGSARLRFAAGLAAYRTGDARGAERLFEDAFARLTAEARADALDLGRILRRRDAESYAALSPADRRQTDSAYWESADPLLSTPENEARLEFQARLALADLRYSDTDLRQTGWRTDRGLILVRYGEPPVVATFAPSSAADAPDAVGRIVTVWYYPRNQRPFVFMGPPAMNYASFAGDMRGFAEENRQNAPFLLDNVPLAANLDTVPVQIARLRGATSGTVALVIAARVNTSSLYRTMELDRSALALSLRLGPPSRLRLSAIDTIPVALPAPPPTERAWTREVPAGRYRVRVEAQDVAVQNAAGRAQDDVDARDRVAGTFEISDMLLVDRVSPPDGPLAGYVAARVVPRGELTFPQRDVFSIYWENYGLRPGREGRVRMDVRVQVTLVDIDRSGDQAVSRVLGNVGDAMGLTREGEQQLGLRYTREEPLGNRDRVPQITTIGLGTAPAGEYRLDLIVTDQESGSVARTSRTFHLTRR
jgi:GWxTD domain-containing protein